MQSCAASVLLCAITSAGLPSFSMIQAIVAVLPVPVAPSKRLVPLAGGEPAASASIAFGWSPVGV